MVESALSFQDVSIRYEHGADPVIVDVSFSVAKAERVALLGLNGSGKTTLLMSAAGLVPHAGVIAVAGIEVVGANLAGVRDKLGFLFNIPEDQILFPRVVDDVAFGLTRRGVSTIEANEQALHALDVFGVAHLARLPPHHLSHGQTQRVALAGALATSPPLLLLDEPSAALDPPGKRALAKVLFGLNAAMLVATHDVDFARKVCTRFVVLEQGRVAYDGTDATEKLERW